MGNIEVPPKLIIPRELWSCGRGAQMSASECVEYGKGTRNKTRRPT